MSDYSYAKGITTSRPARSTRRPSCARTTPGSGRRAVQRSLRGCERHSAAGYTSTRSANALLQAGRFETRHFISGAAALRPDARRQRCSLLRPHRREGTGALRRGPDQGGNWLFNVGIRGDLYNGLTNSARQAEPRLGVAYTSSGRTRCCGPPMRARWNRPFNENLVLSSQGCSNAVLAPLLLCSRVSRERCSRASATSSMPGCSRPSGKNLVFSGDYIWKYTHNAFDFSVLGNTPITFPIDWHNSKIRAYALRADVPNFTTFSAFVVMSSVAARFFPPQVAGAGATVGQGGLSLPHRPRRGSTRRRTWLSRPDVRWNQGDSVRGVADSLPRLAVNLDAGESAGARH
jgi:hypothetical protein